MPGIFGPRALWLGVGNAASGRLAASLRPAALWVSGLCASAEVLGARDMSLLSGSDMVGLARRISLATDGVPVVLDCDSGFGDEHIWQQTIEEIARTTEVAAVVIEDKRFPKRNSFYDDEHALLTTEEFGRLVEIAVHTRDRYRPDLVVVARTETLVAGGTPTDVSERLAAYERAGADAFFIQAKAAEGPLFEAVSETTAQRRPPIVLAPSAFPQRSPSDWWAAGASVVIHANQMLRAALQAQATIIARLMDPELAPGQLDDQMWSLEQLGDLVRRTADDAAP